MLRAAVLIASTLFLSQMALAQSAAAPGHECDWIVANPGIVCSNPVAGTDLRFILTEYQSCQDGRVTEYHQALTVFHLVGTKYGPDIHDLTADSEVQVKYGAKRTHYDNRTNDVSLFLPIQAKAKDGTSRFVINFGSGFVPVPGAVTKLGMSGNFQELGPKGQVLSSGDFECAALAN